MGKRVSMKKTALSAIILSMLFILFSAIPAFADSDFSLTVEAVGDGNVKLVWYSPSDLSYSDTVECKVQRKTSSSGSWKTIATVDDFYYYYSANEYIDESVPFGTTSYYRIVYNVESSDYDYNIGSWVTDSKKYYSNTDSISSKVSKKPHFTVGYGGPTSVELHWTKVDNATGYKIYVYSPDKGEYVLIKNVKSGSTTSWTHEGVKSGVTKAYKIRSYGERNGVTYGSNYSDKLSVKTDKINYKFSAVATSKGNVKLTWEDPLYSEWDKETTKFVVYRKTSSSGKWVKLTTKTVDSYSYESDYSYTDSNVPYGVTVYYKLKVYGKSRTEDYEWFEWDTTSQKKLKSKDIKTPKLKVSTTNNSSSLKLTWDRVDNAAGYKIYVYNASKKKYTLLKTITSGSTTSYTHKGLEVGDTKSYKIKSYGYRNGNKYYSDLSAKASKKLTKNQKIWYPSKTFDSYDVYLKEKSLYYSNGKLKFKALVLNGRYVNVEELNWISITVYDGDTIIADQTFYNRSLNMDPYSVKYVTFTFDEGTKKVVDLRGDDITIYYSGSYEYNYD